MAVADGIKTFAVAFQIRGVADVPSADTDRFRFRARGMVASTVSGSLGYRKISVISFISRGLKPFNKKEGRPVQKSIFSSMVAHYFSNR